MNTPVEICNSFPLVDMCYTSGMGCRWDPNAITHGFCQPDPNSAKNPNDFMCNEFPFPDICYTSRMGCQWISTATA